MVNCLTNAVKFQDTRQALKPAGQGRKKNDESFGDGGVVGILPGMSGHSSEAERFNIAKAPEASFLSARRQRFAALID